MSITALSELYRKGHGAILLFCTVAISSNYQPASEFVPDCDQHTVKFKFCSFSVSSVLTELQSLNISKASGPNGIIAYFQGQLLKSWLNQ